MSTLMLWAMLWATLAVLVGVGFNITWAIVFWSSEGLVWYLHWLGFPIALGIICYGAWKEFKL